MTKKRKPHNIGLAFGLNLGFTVVEFVGAVLTNSVAIAADALHDLGDSLSLGISWGLERRSQQRADHKFTYGYRRLSLLGALVNGLILILGAIWIIREAVLRLQQPEPSHAPGMIGFALLGILVNGFAAYKLRHGQTLHQKVVSWHLWEDVLGWMAILIGGVVLYFTDWYWLDPLLSLGITLWVLYNVVQRLRQTVDVFLQATPPYLDLSEIEARILQFKKVKSLHHSHLWSLDGEQHVFSVHLQLQHIRQFSEIIALKDALKQMLREQYGFHHLTIETELEEESCTLAGNSGGEEEEGSGQGL